MLPRVGVVAFLWLLAVQVPGVASAADWLPVTPDELHMTSVPEAPGAPAVFLYRQVDRNDAAYFEDVYVRLKILTDEGRKYGNVEIHYIKDAESVRGIEARTIRPDGSVETFKGTIYDKPLVSVHGEGLMGKAFDLSDVEPGSIIEYRYRHLHPYGWVFNSHWLLSEQLFTKTARFSLTPNRTFSLRSSWPIGLPPGTPEPHMEKGRVVLESHDVPAFVTEDYMPPENELRYRVDFIYVRDSNPERDPTIFWTKFSKQASREIEDFAGKRAAMERSLAQIGSAGDSPDARLRKIYARVQQCRNLSYERERSAEEISREEPRKARNVEDVWNNNAGDRTQLTWLFMALARAAGFKVDPVFVAARDTRIFDPRLMNPGQLNVALVVVGLPGQDLYLAPGVPFTPYGLLPWWATDSKALRLNAEGGGWVRTPVPDAAVSRIERKASFGLASGTLEGKLTVRFTGLEASWRRLSERNEDDTARRQFLEQEVEGHVPTGIDVKLINSPDWANGETDLVAQYDLQVPGWVTNAGHRELMPVGLFGNGERHTFEHVTRQYPIYFDFPCEQRDDISIELPAGWHVASVPAARTLDLKGVVYRAAAENGQQSLRLTRDLTLNVWRTDVSSYGALRKFFETVRTGDEEEVVFTPDATAAR